MIKYNLPVWCVIDWKYDDVHISLTKKLPNDINRCYSCEQYRSGVNLKTTRGFIFRCMDCYDKIYGDVLNRVCLYQAARDQLIYLLDHDIVNYITYLLIQLIKV